MPKHNRKHHEDITHHFITRALTDAETNIAMYTNTRFNLGVRLVAIDAILAILHKIRSKAHHARTNRERLNIAEVINTQHSVTGLTMLDYCMAAGFHDLAFELMRNGALSLHVDAFQANIRRQFNSGAQPDILTDIQTIVAGCIEIKRQYDQLVFTTHRVMPGVIGAACGLWQRSSSTTLIVLGVGCVALAPILSPLIHVHGIGSAALISAGVLPAAYLGLGASTATAPAITDLRRLTTQDIDAHDLIINLNRMAKKIKATLRAEQERLDEPVPRAYTPEAESSASLLHHFASSTQQQSRDRGVAERPVLRQIGLRAGAPLL